MKPGTQTETDTVMGHHHSGGLSLIFVGVINALIALYSIFQGNTQSFINYESMLLFALSFIALGTWMRTLK